MKKSIITAAIAALTLSACATGTHVNGCEGEAVEASQIASGALNGKTISQTITPRAAQAMGMSLMGYRNLASDVFEFIGDKRATVKHHSASGSVRIAGEIVNWSTIYDVTGDVSGHNKHSTEAFNHFLNECKRKGPAHKRYLDPRQQ